LMSDGLVGIVAFDMVVDVDGCWGYVFVLCWWCSYQVPGMGTMHKELLGTWYQQYVRDFLLVFYCYCTGYQATVEMTVASHCKCAVCFVSANASHSITSKSFLFQFIYCTLNSTAKYNRF
jgi:hypothetical protein